MAGQLAPHAQTRANLRTLATRVWRLEALDRSPVERRDDFYFRSKRRGIKHSRHFGVFLLLVVRLSCIVGDGV